MFILLVVAKMSRYTLGCIGAAHSLIWECYGYSHQIIEILILVLKTLCDNLEEIGKFLFDNLKKKDRNWKFSKKGRAPFRAPLFQPKKVYPYLNQWGSAKLHYKILSFASREQR